MSVTFSYLLDAHYPVFTIGELVAEVAGRLAGAQLACAPVLDEDRYAGMVFLAGLVGGPKGASADAGTLEASMIEEVHPYGPGDQIFDNLASVAALKCGVVPIVDEENRLEGVVSMSRILAFLAERMHSGEGGYTLEIEVPPTGTKLSEIIETIEKNDASVLSFSSWPVGAAYEGKIIFFRIATHDFFRLVRNMENYGYLVRFHSLFPDSGYDELREKALEFIRYMDL